MATSVFRTGRGGTTQARFEREAMLEAALARLTRLDIGDRSLVFGRIDPASTGERFYIGRVGLWDADHDPIVVDWRAPVAEPFYRATGRAPLGLERRRHFASRGSTLLGIEDEFFGDRAAIGFDIADRDFDGHVTDGAATEGAATAADGSLDGQPVSGALIASLEAARTGRLQDVVATIQGEQDRVIRSELPGVLVVQGGPGTGKTVVALHRAAYLLYTHRFPLESQGVLVVGPNRLFLAYIEQVLPSLGEAGVEQAVLADLLSPAVRVAGLDDEAVARVKGDRCMAAVLRRAVRDRRRPLRRDLVVGFELQRLRLTVEQSAGIVNDAARRARKHNAGRRLVEEAFFAALAGSGRRAADPAEIRETLSDVVEVREALDVDVALAHTGPSGERSVRIPGSAALRRRGSAQRRGDRVAVPAPARPRLRDHVVVPGRADTGRGEGAARVPARPPSRGCCAHLRPHCGGRGSGPVADGASHDRSAQPQRLDDSGGRHRASDWILGPRGLGVRVGGSARPAPAAPGGAHAGLPDPGSGDGAGQPGAASRRARGGAAQDGAHRR